MANQVIVTNTGNVQVAIEPTPNVQVQISRAAIGTVSNVPTANYANYAGEAFDVDVGNVTGIGNIAVINLNGNAQTVLKGDGTFGPSSSNSANYANYANFAGEAFNVSGSNVTGAVNLATYATTANAVAGANVSGEVAFAAVANSVAGANVSGQVGNALVAGTVYSNAQPNITSLGTITGLSSSGNISAPYFLGNVVGNISGNIVVPGSNTSVLFNQQGNAGASDAFQFNYATNVATILGNLSATNISGNGAGLSNITGANVSGTVANATYATNAGTAYSVSGANVSGDVSGANHANVADVANSVSGSNVSGAVGLATYATTANSVAGANVSGQVANALIAGTVYTNAQPNITSLGNLTSLTVSGDAGIAGNLSVGGNITYVNVTNLVVQDPVIELGGGPNGAPLTTNDGKDRGTLLHYYTTTPVDAFMGWDNGNGEFAFGSNVTNNSDVMTFNTFGNVRAQTFLGNLTGLASSATVAASANSVTGANVSGDVSGANHANVADVANSVSGSNVSGAVNLATYATTANAVAGANVSGEVSYAAVANSVAGANVSGAVSYATTANAVAGANVSGQVSYAAVANSVALANVSGAGNIASINLDGSSSNVLYGNGAWATLSIPSGNGISNGTSNVSIPVINGNVNTSVGGTPNVFVVTTTGANVTGNLDVSSNVTSNALQLLTTTGVTTANPGQMFWDATNQTVTLGMNNSVQQQIGLESYILVKASSTITDGQVVMFTGATGDNVQAAPADVTSVGFRPGYILGVATQSIATNGTGYITSFGQVHGLNTNAYNVGDLLWLDVTTPGALTATQPSAPNYQIQVATVTKKSGGDGHIQVIIRPEPKLDDLSDVTLTTPTSGQALVNNGSNVWINGNPNVANYAGVVTTNAQPNITSLGNLVSLNINNGVAGSQTKQFEPNGIAIASTANTNLMANSSFVEIDYGNGQADGNVLLPKATSILKARGNATSMTSANVNDRISRTNYYAFNGTANVLTAATQVKGNGTFNANSTGITTGGQYAIITGNPNGDQNNPNALSSLNEFTIDQGGRLSLVAGASIGSAIAMGFYSYGSSVGGNGAGAQNLYFNRYRGNRDNNLGVQANDQLGGMLFSGYNGTAIFATRTAAIRATVDNSYSTNTANIPVGLQFLTCDNTTSYTHQFYANGNVVFNSGKYVTAGGFIGEGGNISNIQGANVSGEVAFAAVANSVAGGNVSGQVSNALIAGTVYTNAQPNITSTGNLVSLNIDNGIAGSTTKQFAPNGIAIGSTANTNLMANSSFVEIDYGNGQGDGNVLLPKATTILKTRGNALSQTTANVNDRISRTNYMVYNGSANVLAVATQANPFGLFNANANAITTAGQYQIITGNPSGDQGNANALSNQNLYQFDPLGRIVITQGAAGLTSTALAINSYGGASGNASATGQNITFQRLRGNRDGNLSVQANDQLGGILFTGYNGTSQFATRTAAITGLVDSSYSTNTANIPAGLRFQTCDTTTSYTHQFYANGNVVFSSGKTLTAGYFYGDGSNLTGVGVGNVISTGQINLNPTSNGAPQLNLNGNSAGGNTGGMTLNDAGLNVNINGATFPGGAPSFAFSTYQTGGTLPPQFYKRYGGTTASPTGVANGDVILNQYYQVYGDSGNSNMTIGGVLASVGNIASPGNISFNYQIYSQGNSTDKIDINFPTINLNGNVTANTISTTSTGTGNIANLQLNRFQETVYSIGSISGTYTPDFNNGSIQSMTLTGSVTINSLANAVAGRSMTLIVTQGGSGSYTLTSSMLFQGNNRTLSTAVGAIDIISVFYDGSTYYATLSTGYA